MRTKSKGLVGLLVALLVAACDSEPPDLSGTSGVLSGPAGSMSGDVQRARIAWRVVCHPSSAGKDRIVDGCLDRIRVGI
jgi:hypothetical protein